MKRAIRLTVEELIKKAPELKVGDIVELSGVIYTARDAEIVLMLV